jgi:UDP-N-acetylglucosamine 1-carboxyvinyltransferase
MTDILIVRNFNEHPTPLKSKCLIIEKAPLQNTEIKISGYRHSSNLLISAAIIAADTTVTLHNVPDLLDSHLMIEIVNQLGADASFANSTATLNTRNLSGHQVPNDLSQQIPGSLYLLPALLAKCKKVIFAKSGGCQIGAKDKGFERPIQHVLDMMKIFGAKINIKDGLIYAEAQNLTPSRIIDIHEFSFEKDKVTGPLTSGATKTAILLALAVKTGKTIIINPFLKSEAVDLLDFVKALGYKVKYDQSKIEIEYAQLHQAVSYSIISDPSEIITYFSIAGFHKIDLRLTNITLTKTWPILKPELDLLTEMGVSHVVVDNVVTVSSAKELTAVDIEITPTGVCTDHHPFLMLLMLKANKSSHLTEHVWHDRFNYIDEVNKYGVGLKQIDNSVAITPATLQPTDDVIYCPDLRAAAMLAIIAMDAPSKSTLENYGHLGRGYVNFIPNLKRMGGMITEADL